MAAVYDNTFLANLSAQDTLHNSSAYVYKTCQKDVERQLEFDTFGPTKFIVAIKKQHKQVIAKIHHWIFLCS